MKITQQAIGKRADRAAAAIQRYIAVAHREDNRIRAQRKGNGK